MEIRQQTILNIKGMAKNMRINALKMAMGCGSTAHIGGALSFIDIMAVLYGAVLKYDKLLPQWEDRDRFILSKGHGVLGFYPVLAEAGIIKQEMLETFQNNGTDLVAHPVMNLSIGIESSNGSLGQGLSMAVGISIAAKKLCKKYRTFVLLGNGECNEGSVWEAAMSAAHYKLDNLFAIIDNNSLQSDGKSEDVLNMGDMRNKWEAFGWNTVEIDGHDIEALLQAFTSTYDKNRPTVMIANTIKGKGVSFMENNNEWHHNRLTQELYEIALAEQEEI
ncbi:MAG: transketolase [Ruminiclostridium sp.]